MESGSYNKVSNVWRIITIVVALATVITVFLPYFTIEDSYSIFNMFYDYKPFMVTGMLLLILPIVTIGISVLPNSLNTFKSILIAALGIGELVTKLIFDSKLTSEADDVNAVFSDFISLGYYLMFGLAILPIVLSIIMLFISLKVVNEVPVEVPQENVEEYAAYQPVSNVYDYNFPPIQEQPVYVDKQAPLALQQNQPTYDVINSVPPQAQIPPVPQVANPQSSTDQYFQNNPAPADYYTNRQAPLSYDSSVKAEESNDGMKNYPVKSNTSLPQNSEAESELDKTVNIKESATTDEPEVSTKVEPETWVCSCGHVNIEVFCPVCGKAKDGVDTKFCPKCGNTVIKGVMFCDKCGSNVNMDY